VFLLFLHSTNKMPTKPPAANKQLEASKASSCQPGHKHTTALTTTQVRQGMADLRALLETGQKPYELYKRTMPRLPDMTVEQFCFSVVLATHKKRRAHDFN
jgi:hypothetical protein